jgi:hypothetical protein
VKEQKIKHHLRRTFSVLAVVAGLAVGALFAVPHARADYGQGAVYQIELSADDNLTEHGQGGGIWLWIALYPDGTGDYSGSDCISQAGRYGFHGAYPDNGDVTWTYANNDSQVVISGVLIEGWAAIGFDPNLTITVPSLYGHYTGTIGTFLTLMPGNPPIDPNGGMSQLQVAP